MMRNVSTRPRGSYTIASSLKDDPTWQKKIFGHPYIWRGIDAYYVLDYLSN